jgi:hypothetical protein
MSAPQATKLGPGLLTIGPAGTLQDISCLLSAAKVEWDKDKEDDTPVLCGDTIAGSTTYTATLSGTLAQDLYNKDGIVNYTWAHKGEPQPFVFVPSNAAGQQVTGTVVVDPLMVGGDEVKKNMMSDFEWDCVGEPDLSDYTAPATATGATAGIPGSWTPGGSTPPATLAELQGSAIVANPATGWTVGQYVKPVDNSHAHWTGSAWATGDAP